MEIKKIFLESGEIIRKFIEMEEKNIVKCIELLIKTIKNGKKIIICGNGGSAADAQHFAAELSGKFRYNRKPLPAISLTTNTSALTAISNDFGFEKVFERQLESIGNEGDVLIGISTSGNSENIINAVRKAKKLGIYSIGLLGKNGGKLKDLVDLAIIVPSDETPRIQESHLVAYHTICEEVEKKFLEG